MVFFTISIFYYLKASIRNTHMCFFFVYLRACKYYILYCSVFIIKKKKKKVWIFLITRFLHFISLILKRLNLHPGACKQLHIFLQVDNVNDDISVYRAILTSNNKGWECYKTTKMPWQFEIIRWNRFFFLCTFEQIIFSD